MTAVEVNLQQLNNANNNKKKFKEELLKVLYTHKEGEGEYCDTGEDMEWCCRSKCVELAAKRIEEFLKKYGV